MKRTSREVTMRWQMHDIVIPAGTKVERAHATGPWAVHPTLVKLVSSTRALFVHDSTYYFIFVNEADLEDAPNA